MANNSFDALVIGAGAIGCSVAYRVAGTGRKVCVVDRGYGAGGGSTSSSSTVVRFNYSTWAGVATAWESRQAWLDWAEHLGIQSARESLARLITVGGLTLDSPGQQRETVLGLFDRVGVPYQVWDAAAIQQHLPYLTTGRFYPPKPISDPAFWSEPNGQVSGYWTPDAGFVDDPQLAAQNLMEAARRLGTEFRFRSSVSAIRQRNGRAAGVELSNGTVVEAPVIVNVAGPHSGAINRLAGVGADFNVTTRPMRQEVHQLPAPPGYNTDLPGPLIADLDLGTYFRGTLGDGMIVGGTEPECDPLEWLDEPDAFNIGPTRQRYEAQTLRAARRMPTLRLPDEPKGVAGVYDVSDDWIPVYDRTDLDGFYVAIGTSGNQFKNAPVVGDYLAAIVDACENGHDHDNSPVSVTLPRTGHRVDLAHYSRKRSINTDSSLNVMG